MSVEAVLDTNVLLYAASKDPAESRKAEVALGLLRSVDFGVPMQVLQEFFHNARVKARMAIEANHCERMIAALLRRPMVTTDTELFTDARRICRRHSLQYWDAAVLAAARRLGAATLYSEDLSHGHSYEGVRVVNPFRSIR